MNIENFDQSELNEFELDAASGGTASSDIMSGLDGASLGAPPVKRVKTSDKQQAAVMAFIKG